MKPVDVIDFSLFTSAMIDAQQGNPGSKSSKKSESLKQLFSKKPLLQISKLRLTQFQNKHLKENKMSEKLGRRDI